MADQRLLKHYRFIAYDAKRRSSTRLDADLARRFLRVGHPLFTQLFTAETGRVISSKFNQKHLAENVFFKSLTDLEKRVKTTDYYICNAELFLYYMPIVCRQIIEESAYPHGRAAEYLMQSYALLQRHSWYISHNGFEYGLWKSEFTEYFRLFGSSSELIAYQPVSDINCGSATLRMAIESRIRSALGVFGIYCPNRKEMKNVNMSKLFAAIIQRRDYIECEVDIKLVELVYKWTNNFIHSSFNTFPWLIQFSHDLLALIFKHTKYDGHFDLLAGIRMHPSILVAIRDDILKPYLSDNPGAYIYGTREADCYVGFLKGSVP